MYTEEPIVVTCTCNSATPITSATPKQTVQATIQAVQECLDSSSDEPLPSEEPSPEEVKKAQGFLEQFGNYIKSQAFKDDVNFVARTKGLPPKQVANNFFEKALGTIADVSGIVVETTRNAGHTLIDVLAMIAHGALNVVCNVANALIGVVTLNKTCVATA